MAITEESATMSSAVDRVVARSGMPHIKDDVVGFLRLTARECEGLRYFRKSWVEDQLTPDADPYTWTHPSRVRAVEFVQYPHIFAPDGRPIDPVTVKPNRAKWHRFYYYTGESYTIFGGHYNGASVLSGAAIDVGYYQWAKPLAYYEAVADRPARYDLVDETWEYHDDYSATEELQLAARELVQNWLFRDWFELMVQGAMSKVFHTYGDQRATASYAAYKQAQDIFVKNERTRDLHTSPQ